MAKKTRAAKPMVDVAHPGKSAPSGNSKSVIVSNRPLLKDPMMIEDTPAKDDKPSEEKAAIKTPSQQPVLQPLTAPLLESEKPDNEVVAEKPSLEYAETPLVIDKTPEPEAETDPQEENPVPVEKPAPPEEPVEKSEPANPETPEGNPAAPKDKNNPKQSEIESAEHVQHQAEIDKLVDSKKYFLPINAVEKRRSRRFVAAGILLSLLLIAAWVNIALDAGLIEINGIKPLTHFFSS